MYVTVKEVGDFTIFICWKELNPLDYRILYEILQIAETQSMQNKFLPMS